MAARGILVALLLLVPASLPALGWSPVTPLALEAPAALLPVPPTEHARAVLQAEAFLGRTPEAWLGWAHGQFAPQASAPAPAGDLRAAMGRLYQAVGVASPLGLEASLAPLDPALAAALAPLVDEVATAYEVQALVLRNLDWTALGRGALQSEADIGVGLARAQELRAALDAFRAGSAGLPAPGVQVSDPYGLVRIGTAGGDTFTRGAPNEVSPLGDPVLLLDLGGNDLDRTSAGGACPLTANPFATCNGLALAVRADLAGDDTYAFASNVGLPEVVQGSGGFGGLGLLVDYDGQDTYTVDQFVTDNTAITYITGVSQGSGEGGIGMLADLAGDDTYVVRTTADGHETYTQAQAFAGAGGAGVLLDASGDDDYTGDTRCTTPDGRINFCGTYIHATALFPGVAVMVDGAGNDDYVGFVSAPQEDYYSQSFAAFGAFALLVDLGDGDDTYEAIAISTHAGGFDISLNCAFGTAEYAGAVAVMVDAGGDDSYYDETISPNTPYTMAEGYSLASASLFWEVRGNDLHQMRANGPNPILAGRGTIPSPLEAVAAYLDSGGVDVYHDEMNGVDATIGGDGQVWAIGADLNLL